MRHIPVRLPDGKIRLAYILSASHSGSTLLAMLLNAHSEICSVGELKATALGEIGRYRCSCRRWMVECPFWGRIEREMRMRGLDFDISTSPANLHSGASSYISRLLHPLHRGRILEAFRDLGLEISPAWRPHLQNFMAINVALMDVILTLTGKKILVDSSKIGIRLKYLLQTEGLEVKIIRVVRDGRAVSLTYMDPAAFADARDHALRGGGSGGDRRKEVLPMEKAAREWRRSNEEADALLRQVEGAKWIGIRYEDLCLDPDETLDKVCGFLGVDRYPILSGFRAMEHHVIGNGMRLDDSGEIKLDKRWKTSLSASELRIFNRTAGSLNRRLGYA